MGVAIEMVKPIRFQIQIIYDVSKNKIKQKFLFLPHNKKYFRYVYDKRYALKDSIEKKIKHYALSERLENVKFVDRFDEETFIEMNYEFEGEIDFSEVRGLFFTIHIYFPPNTGCEFCEKAQDRDGFIYCIEKNKTIPIAIKRCSVFEQKKDIIIT